MAPDATPHSSLPAAQAPLAQGTGIRKADACLCLFFTHSCCFMVFFVVEGSAGSRSNLPALGKEMYPLAFLALVGNAPLLPPACWRGRASPNSPEDGKELAVSKLCLAAPLGCAVRSAPGGSPAATDLEIGRKCTAAPVGMGSAPEVLWSVLQGLSWKGFLCFPCLCSRRGAGSNRAPSPKASVVSSLCSAWIC